MSHVTMSLIIGGETGPGPFPVGLHPTVTTQTGSPGKHMEQLRLGDAECPSLAGTHPGLSVPSCGWDCRARLTGSLSPFTLP